MARRRWEFDIDNGRHVVEFEHGYFTAFREVPVAPRGRAELRVPLHPIPVGEPGR